MHDHAKCQHADREGAARSFAGWCRTCKTARLRGLATNSVPLMTRAASPAKAHARRALLVFAIGALMGCVRAGLTIEQKAELKSEIAAEVKTDVDTRVDTKIKAEATGAVGAYVDQSRNDIRNEIWPWIIGIIVVGCILASVALLIFGIAAYVIYHIRVKQIDAERDEDIAREQACKTTGGQ